MNVDFAFICDYAEARDKIYALGIGFDTVYAAKLPTRARFYVVAQLRFGQSETGTNSLAIHLIDADGKDVIKPVSGQIEVNTPPPGMFETTARFTMAFDGTEFKNYGDYSLKIRVNGQQLVSIPLRVAAPPKAA